ncbi:MAG: hypothetical protein K8I03_01935 [Ignavibacteria bacterium]|nr:hypothetical protein [Ignavibacteria bacterium]
MAKHSTFASPALSASRRTSRAGNRMQPHTWALAPEHKTKAIAKVKRKNATKSQRHKKKAKAKHFTAKTLSRKENRKQKI